MHGMEPAPAAKPRRRWRTISLRTFLLLIALVAVLLGREVNRVRAQRHAVAMMKDAGGVLFFDDEIDDEGEFRPASGRARPVWQQWLMRTLGDDYVRKARTLGFLATRNSKLAWRAMRDLPDLVSIDLDSMDVDDSRLALLGRYSGLRYLVLRDNPRITDAGLVHLAGLRRLRGLFLEDTRIGDAGLAHVTGLSHLEFLDLDGTRVTDAGLAHLGGLHGLDTLSLNGTRVTDAGLAYLRDLPHLETLLLNETRVTDAGLEHLAGSLSLTMLSLDKTQVGDAGLSHLSKLNRLWGLNLRRDPSQRRQPSPPDAPPRAHAPQPHRHARERRGDRTPQGREAQHLEPQACRSQPAGASRP